MGSERNDAYAGRHTLPTGDKVTVEYLNRGACEKLFNAGVKRNNSKYRKVGWYFTVYSGPDPKTSVVAVWHGPFSASGVALAAAKTRFAAAIENAI